MADCLEQAVEHNQSLTDSDWDKLRLGQTPVFFNDIMVTSDAGKLTYFSLFWIAAHFSLRGSELQSKLLKSDLVFGENDEGK